MNAGFAGRSIFGSRTDVLFFRTREAFRVSCFAVNFVDRDVRFIVDPVVFF